MNNIFYRLFLVLFLFFALYSCVSNTHRKKKCEFGKDFQFRCFKNVNLKKIKRCSVFYGNNLKVIVDSMIKNGEKGRFGDYLKFYDNGQIKLRGCYENGLKHGQFIFYRKNGTMKKVVTYFKGDENYLYYFDKKGNLLPKNSSYLKVSCRDTIKINDRLKVNVEVKNPYFGTEWFKGAVGNQRSINNEYEIIDTSLSEYIDVKGGKKFKFYLRKHESGRNEVRGYINNIKRVKGYQDSVMIHTYYFKKSYQVIDS